MFSGQGNIEGEGWPGKGLWEGAQGTTDIYGWACWGLGGRPRPVLGGLTHHAPRPQDVRCLVVVVQLLHVGAALAAPLEAGGHKVPPQSLAVIPQFREEASPGSPRPHCHHHHLTLQ